MPISLWEILIIAIIAIVVIGPKKLPATLKKGMMWYKHIRGSMQDIQQKIDDTINEELADGKKLLNDTKQIVDETKDLLEDAKIPKVIDFEALSEDNLKQIKKNKKKTRAKKAKKSAKMPIAQTKPPKKNSSNKKRPSSGASRTVNKRA